MKRRILFVDDEPNILEGLRNRLHRQRSRWDMEFVTSGKRALEVLASQPIDVIVSDMRMPEMDGATLLREVQSQYPNVVRVVLSGQAEVETALRAVPVAHQFLAKPSEPGIIDNVVERACSLQLLINDDAVKRTIGRIDRLPSLPKIYSDLTVALANEAVTVADITAILKRDIAMCAKVLQLVNSAFFRLSRVISRIEDAVSYLGFNAIKHLALAATVYTTAGVSAAQRQLIEELHAHALQVAGLAMSMFDEKIQKQDAFVVGLLHDIGKLLLITELPDQMTRIVQEMESFQCSMNIAEERIMGVTHAEIGAYLLGLWGLPYPIVEAVANHHTPQRVATREFGLLGAAYVADRIAHEQLSHCSDDTSPLPVCDELDAQYIDELGITENLARWRSCAVPAPPGSRN